MTDRFYHSLIIIGLAFTSVLKAGAAEVGDSLSLWPQKAPGETGAADDETRLPDRGDGVIRYTNVSQPTLTLFQPAEEKATGAAMIICPGGAYRHLAFNKEGTEVAEWLNTIGVTAFVLKYRVPSPEGRPRWEAALQDLQRAVGIIRSRAQEWGIDPERVGVLGFSAGGHLAAALSTNYQKRTYAPLDGADQFSCRPSVAVVVYPGYLRQGEGFVDVSAELAISADTPPTLLIQSADDSVHVENSVAYYMALKRAEVPVEMHLYPSGGHGYGLRPTHHDVSSWPDRCRDFLLSHGMLTDSGETPDYLEAISKRAEKIVASLGLSDEEKHERVHRLVTHQYRWLNREHADRDTKMAAAQGDERKQAYRAASDDAVKKRHAVYVASLMDELTTEQVDMIKDGMTYGVLKLTYDGYLKMLPGLTEEQKRAIMGHLVEAREIAMDGGSSKEKHGWFGKYKGRINNYLSKEGYDLKAASKRLHE